MSSFEALQEEAKKSILGNTTGVSSLLGIKYPWGCTCEDVRSGNMTSEVTRKVKKYQYQLFAKTVYHYRTEKAKKPTEVVTSNEGTDVGLYSNIASTLAYKWFYKYYKKLYTDKYTFIKKARSHSLGTDGDFNSETKDLKPLSSAILQVGKYLNSGFDRSSFLKTDNSNEFSSSCTTRIVPILTTGVSFLRSYKVSNKRPIMGHPRSDLGCPRSVLVGPGQSQDGLDKSRDTH